MIRTNAIIGLASVLGTFLVTSAIAAPMPGEGGGGEGGPAAARVSYLDGTVYCWGPFDEEKRNLMINDLVREGDEIYAAPGTFVEVELPGATFLRLDGGSSVVVRAYHDDLRLVPSAGSFYLSTGDWTEAQLQFGPDGAEVASASLARVSISPDEYRSLAVVYGLARVINHEATIEVADNQQVSASDHAAPWTSAEFYPNEEGAFDIWSMEREEHLRGVPQDDSPSYPLVGYNDLQEHGNWVAVDGVWCWRPRYVDVDWRPYTVGEWTWYPDYGWVWVSGYTWGYVTYHHGRWNYDPFYGWVWMPGMVWSPAWVSWAVFDGYVAWAPIGWWGWPVVASAHWHSYWHHGCWTFAHYDYFYHGGYHHHGAYHYSHYHQHHHYSHTQHNSHHRSSSGHHSSHGNHGGASASNSRDGGVGSSHGRGVSDSNDRGNLGQSIAGERSAGANFRTFDQQEFEAMDRTTVKDANKEIMQSASMNASDRVAFERGGDDRMALVQRQHDFDRGSRGDGRGTSATGRGGDNSFSGDQGRGSAAGNAAVDRGEGGQGRTTYRPDGNGSFTPTRPTDRGQATDQRGVQQRARDSLNSSNYGQRQVSPTPERRDTPAVPQYSGRSDSQRQFTPQRSNTERYSGQSASGSQYSRDSSSQSSNRQSGSRSSTSSNSSNRSRQSGSTTRSGSGSSSGSKKSSSGSSSRSSSKKKKKK